MTSAPLRLKFASGCDLDRNEQIARCATVRPWMALALHAHTATFHSTRRHLDGKGLLLLRFGVHHAYFLFSTFEGLIERNRERDLLVRSLFRLRLTSATPEIPIRSEGSFTVTQAFQDVGPVDATTATAAEGIASAACGVSVGAATEGISSPKRIAPLEGNLVLVRGAVLVVHLAFFIIRKAPRRLR